ncbi:PaREP1 family protein [Acidianus infernus]|uniref:PaREP1 family protein n=1 Tax=Acidianus infernus TaxID=12915 RepID=UPI00359401DA
MQELPKPWFDLNGYKKTRLEEAEFEANIAEEFLKEGLLRNAAGKAFQAWKALIAAMLTEKRDELLKKYPGKKRLSVEFADWLIAIVPTSYMEELSLFLGKEVNLVTKLALAIHDYQYNGADKETVLSPFRSDEIAKENIQILISEIRSRLEKMKKS